MNKTVKAILCTLCCVLALYGLILLIRKVLLSPDTPRMTKKDLGYSFYLEPFRQYGREFEEGLRKQEEIIEELNRNVDKECLKRCKGPYCLRKCQKDKNEKFEYKWYDLEDPQIIKERNTKCLQNKWKICSSKGDNLTYDKCMNLNDDSFLLRYQNECKLVQNNVNDFIATDLPDLSNVINL